MFAQLGSHGPVYEDDDTEVVVAAGPVVDAVPRSEVTKAVVAAAGPVVDVVTRCVTDGLVDELDSGSGSGSGEFAACALIEYRTKAPDSVSSLKCHPPLLLAPGIRAAHCSLLSLIAQFASDML